MSSVRKCCVLFRKEAILSARQHYYRGQYKKAAEAKIHDRDLGYKIAGLVFTGDHATARLIYKNHENRLSLENQVVARFHIGISYVRTSDYRRARLCFHQNQQLKKTESLSPLLKWFVYQGMSFYCYFFSQHHRSQSYAEKAYAELLKIKHPQELLVSLSLDIQAHNLFQMGQMQQALKLHNKAFETTRRLKLTDWSSEIEISLAVYKSESHNQVTESLKNLLALLNQTSNRNDHSRSELILQITKLHIWQGEYAKANHFLTQHFHFIYQNENKRKIAKLNTLLAYLMLLKGQWLQVLSLTRVALKNLDEKIDMALILPILGLEYEALNSMGLPTQDNTLHRRKLLSLTDRRIHFRIENRLNKGSQVFPVGEDPLGDTLDGLRRQDPKTLKLAIESKLWGWIPFYFKKLPFQKSLIYVESIGQLISFDDSSVIVHAQKINRSQWKLLSLLSQGFSDKERILKTIWGYEYDPLRHDNLIYSSMVRLRKNLHPRESWVASDDRGYSLMSDVELFLIPLSKQKIETSPLISQQSLQNSNQSKKLQPLNYRQLDFIHNNATPRSVSQYGESYNVTRMTALRDLSHLISLDLVIKVGRGKATRYCVKNEAIT